MRRKTSRVLAGSAAVLALWVVLAQTVLCRNRMSDDTIKALAARKGIGIRLRDTIVSGRNIHYAVTGNDTLPTLFFIHGSPGSWSNYRKYMWDDTLLSRFRMIAFDRPGFGYSGFGDALRPAASAELIASVLKHLDNGKPSVLCGHSMGAPIAIAIAALHPELAQRLLLVGAPLDAREEKPEAWRHIMNVKPLYYLLPGAFGPSNTELLYLKEDLPAIERLYPALRCDVSFIHGSEDDWVPIENLQLAVRTMSHVRSIHIDTVKGAGHLIPWKNEELFRSMLRAIRL